MTTVDFGCPDWQDKLRNGQTPMADLPLDEKAAEAAVGIFNNLRLPDVEGFPRLEDACGEWFRDIVRAGFGSVDPDTRERFLNEIFCLVPKKNSKTTYSAAYGITALLLNKVPNATMVILGPTKELADTLFSQASGIIEADPEDEETGRSYLQDRFHVDENGQTITDRWNKTTLKVKSFSTKVVTGVIPILTIIDEIHILGEDAKAAKVMKQIKGGMIAKPEALLLMITTQSDGPPSGVFRKELEYARAVRDGAITDTATLPILYEFPADIQTDKKKPWRDPELWPLVMPNLGRSITIPRLMRLYKKDLAGGADDEMSWASQHLNIQIGMGTMAGGWVGGLLWPDAVEPMSLDQLLDQSDCITVGIDGGGLDDLLGLGVIGRHAETRRWHIWARAWVMPVVLDRRQAIATRLQDFAAAGDVIICDDPTQDLREVTAICKRVYEAGLLPKEYAIGLDPAGVTALVDELSLAGMSDDLLSAVSQGYRLQPAIKGLERKLNDGTAVHCGQQMLDWCVSNAKTEPRGNATMITKAVSGSAKIDPLMGVFNAAMLMARNPEASGGGLGDFLDNPVMVI